MTRALVVAGARPNFMKVAPVLRALSAHGHEALLTHTGQHYDEQMSDAFFKDLGLPHPDFHLGVGGGSHAAQTARIMEAFEPILLSTRPSWLVVVGDVNSTLACALVASKLKSGTGTRIAHVEAGLRSNDWRMPEEVNRVLTDRLSDLLLTPSRDALPNLISEGIPESRVEFVGNVMIDTLYAQLPRARNAAYCRRLGLEPGAYAIATLHRPSNVDDPETLGAILRALDALRDRLPVVFPVHPRTRKNIVAFGLEREAGRLLLVDPLGYVEMLSLVNDSAVVLTDSGGLQEESTVLGIPCLTLRESTERPSTIEFGTNSMADWPLTLEGLIRSANRAIDRGRTPLGSRVPEGWDGKAASRIVHALEKHSSAE